MKGEHVKDAAQDGGVHVLILPIVISWQPFSNSSQVKVYLPE